jgi:hypothetical protein
VAEPCLIDAYLNELRFSLGKLRDLDDVLAEVADHLELSADQLVRSGLARHDAEAQALARFGSPALVARVFAEEAKRGGAVSTTLTRRAGLAAMVAPPLMIAGGLGANAASSTQPGSGIGAAACLAATAMFVFALVGLRVRHGGLGLVGRIAFWLAMLAVPVAMPFGYAGIVVLAVELGVVVSLYGIAMLRAAILPPVPVSLFAFSWPAWAPVALAITAGGGDANTYAVIPGLVTLAALMWIGRALWREPALDARSTRGPFATA